MPVVTGGNGEVAVSGAAAHLVQSGDVIAIAAYGWVKEKAATRHAPRVVKADAQNRIASKPGGAAEPVEAEPPKKEKKAKEITFRRVGRKSH
jgi:aspartate 1-decarboxylase